MIVKIVEKCCEEPAEVKITKVLSISDDYKPIEDDKYFIKRHPLLFYPCGMCRIFHARIAHALLHFLAVGVGLVFWMVYCHKTL